jgi:hypothetical protein
MIRRASILGYASLACSLAFWVLYALHLIPGFPKRIDLTFSYWAAIWVVAIILALLAATARRSWRWAVAALLPVANFLIIFLLIGLSEPRGH